MLARKRETYKYGDLLGWEGERYELIDGEAVMMAQIVKNKK